MASSTVNLKSERFPYDSATCEPVACNLCGSTESEPIEDLDRNGLRVHSVICRKCGLIYLTPRMTPD